MTEKRFRYKGAQIFDNDEFLCCTLSIWKEQLVDLLNDLHEENIKLHIQNDFLKDENQHMRDLVNENEQLKSILKEMVRVSECNGAISPMRIKSMTYNFIGDL